MVLSLFLSISWILGGITIALKDKFPRQQFAFTWLVANFINTNLFYLLGEGAHLFELSRNPLYYVSFSLIQSVIIPIFIAIMINLRPIAQSASARAALHVGSILFLVGIEALTVSLTIISYSGIMKFIYFVSYKLILFYFLIFALSLFRRMCKPT
ncbi:hypothetical protein [Paenibacillus aestuarii]|uniref:Histidine kinase N-terminal 7TM region domain-containing protein n=1 Tax=Paenibacillus aestuarii TaxID=516965 RepID=A0ABW0K6F7_9BACL|nr:hypothetical protein [Paenibacillus aestuarii]